MSERWRALGGSATGFLHTQAGRGCDDAHGWQLDDGLIALVTADGAGSRPGTSALGAHLAVVSVLETCADLDFHDHFDEAPDQAVHHLFRTALDRLTTHADQTGYDVGRLATTLSVALVGRAHVVVAQIGDGIAVIEADGAIEAVAVAERFEYANEVVFVTSAGAIDGHLKIHRSTPDEVRSIALATDGLRYKVLDDLHDGTPYRQFYADTWAYARREGATSAAIEQFLATVDDQTGDDKTLVVAVRDIDGAIAEPHHLSARPAEQNDRAHDPAAVPEP